MSDFMNAIIENHMASMAHHAVEATYLVKGAGVEQRAVACNEIKLHTKDSCVMAALGGLFLIFL